MKYTTDNRKLNAVLDEIKELENLLTERIVDLHEMKGYVAVRHAHILYRQRLLEIKQALLDAVTEVPEKTKKP
jgi:uncharacterized protein YutE (UPF0331/DUF86 family)